MSSSNGLASSFISDGYTREGYVKPVEGLHDGLTFTFRPALRATRLAVAALSITNESEAEIYAKKTCELMAKHVLTWKAPGDCKKPQAWATLHSEVFKDAMDQVLGYKAPGVIPAEQEAGDVKN